jgi:phenylpropionate dioxygenase-like ring-hydroxylating dioxygenase large terminal subunit
MNDSEALRWTRAHPELGSEPIPAERLYAQAYFERERDEVFGKSWLLVARETDLPRPGTWVTVDIPSPHAAVLLMRGEDGAVRAFHNTCQHRGGRLAHPRCGAGKGITCPLHGWTYGLQGALAYVPIENGFATLPRERLGLRPVACAVWEGFVFVNLDPRPAVDLPTFLGEPVRSGYGGYFGALEEAAHYTVETRTNWKTMLDVSLEAYHALSIHPIHPVLDDDNRQVGVPAALPEIKVCGLELWRLHRQISAPGNPFRPQSPVEQRMVQYGVDSSFTYPAMDGKAAGLPPLVNPHGEMAWSFDVLGLFPNTIVLTGRGLAVTISMWPRAVDRTFFEIRLYMTPVTNMAARVVREALIAMTRDVMREDLDHVEPQQSALYAGAITHLHLCDEEAAVRHGYVVLERVMREGLARAATA